MDSSTGECIITMYGVRQCLLSSILSSIFLERIMSHALETHDRKFCIGGRNITNMRFADDIDTQDGEEKTLEVLVEGHSQTYTNYKMICSVEKSKLMTCSLNGIQREIKIKRQKLDIVTSFRYLGAIVSDRECTSHCISHKAEAKKECRPLR